MASEYNTDPGQGYRIPRRRKKPAPVSEPPPPPAGMPYKPPPPDQPIFQAAVRRALGEDAPLDALTGRKNGLIDIPPIHPFHADWAHYYGYLQKLWQAAAPFYPGGEDREEMPVARPMPWPEDWDEGDPTPYGGAEGVTLARHGVDDPVLYSPGTYYSSDDDFSKAMPLHEWTHVYQNPNLPQYQTEGGAQLLEHAASRRLGLSPAQTTPQYARWAQQLRRRVPHWRNFIHSGQFG